MLITMMKDSGKLIFISALVLSATLWSSGAFDLMFVIGCLLTAGLLHSISQRRPLAEKWLMVFVSILSTLLIFDVAFRIFGRDFLYYRPHERFVHKHPRCPVVSRYQANAVYNGFSYGDLASISRKKHLRVLRKEAFETDSLGFRNKRGAETRRHDVVILADSFGVGVGTTQDKIWPVVLERELGKSVYNLSMVGNPWQHLINFEMEIGRLQLNPGAVVLLGVFSGNDLDEYYAPEAQMSQGRLARAYGFVKTTVGTFRARSPVKIMAKALSSSKTRFPVYGRDMGDKGTLLFHPLYLKSRYRTRDEINRHIHFAPLKAAILRLKQGTDDRGLILRLIFFPSKEEVYGWLWDGNQHSVIAPSAFAEALQGICAEAKIPFTDLTIPLTQKARQIFNSTGEWLWWTDDTHPNELGHKLIAEEILKSAWPRRRLKSN